MKLFVDIGNTRTKWVVVDGRDVIERGAIKNTNISEFSLNINAALSGAWASCVAQNQIFQLFADVVERQYGAKLNRARVQASAGGLTNKYRALDRLGVDRWLAALGGRQIIESGNLVVIDAGTAVTVDFVSAQNCFEGGVILPGANMMNDALVGRTAGIVSEMDDVDSVIGRTTQECVNAGSFYGLAGAIVRVVDEMRDRANANQGENERDPFTVLLCGGDAPRLSVLLPDFYKSEPDLVFQGLSVMALDQHGDASDGTIFTTKTSLR